MNSDAKVGATAIAGLLLMIAMILYLSGAGFTKKGYPVNAVFSQVNGLTEGNTVSYAGVHIGTVRSIGIMPDGIKVEMTIDSNVKIPKKSKFTISSSGLLGEQYVNVLPVLNGGEKGEYILPNETVCGQNPHGLDELMQISSETMYEIKEVVSSLREILGDENVKKSLKETAVNAKEITDNINKLAIVLSKLAQENQNNVNETITNLALMSGNLRDLVERVNRMAVSFDNNGQTTQDLKEIIGNLKDTSRRVGNMAASLENVVADPQTAQELKEIIHNSKNVTKKANDIMSKTTLKTSTDLEMLYDFKDEKYQSNAYFKIGREGSKSFAILGFSDIGDRNLFNLQYGREISRLTERMGIIDNKVGLGVDAKLSKDWEISFDMYDPNEVKYKLRSKYQVTPDIAVIGQTDRIKGRADLWHNYFGLQRKF